MQLPILEPAPLVANHAEVFRELFENRCQFQHFKNYLTGLMVLPNKSMANIARCMVESSDKTNISRYFSGAQWLEEQVNDQRVKYRVKETKVVRLAKDNSMLLLDGTLCEHVRSLFEYVDHHTSIATVLPFGCRCQQENPFRSPTSDPHGFEVGIITNDCPWVECEESLLFLFKHLVFGKASRLDVYQLGKTGTITGQMQAVAIYPTMISAFTPTGILIQIAQFLGYPTRQTIRLVPNWSIGFEKTGVFDQNATIELRDDRNESLVLALVGNAQTM